MYKKLIPASLATACEMDKAADKNLSTDYQSFMQCATTDYF